MNELSSTIESTLRELKNVFQQLKNEGALLGDSVRVHLEFPGDESVEFDVDIRLDP